MGHALSIESHKKKIIKIDVAWQRLPPGILPSDWLQKRSFGVIS
jgi:hypothetical protein